MRPTTTTAPRKKSGARDIDSLADSQILPAVQLLSEPGQVIELRMLSATLPGLRNAITLSGYFNDFAALAKEARMHSKSARGTYITLNPVHPALLARAANRVRTPGKDDPLTADTDITRRRWLPIDLDPVRPSGISSTDEEHQIAIERAFEMRDVLREEGWPDPIVADSGNGSHLLYRVELGSDDHGIVKKCLHALALRFNDDRVRVDQSVFNAARIWKLYGSVSRKGDDVPERPHRLAQILEAP